MTKHLLSILSFLSVFGLSAQNKALTFDGIDDKIDLFLRPIKKEWTISAWIKGNDNKWNAVETVISNSWAVIPEWEAEPLSIKNGYPCVGDSLISSKKLDNEWHHLAVVNNGKDYFLYLDGKLEAQGKGGKGICPTSIASSNDKAFFEGTIDEIRIWETALDQKRIVEWMNKPLTKKHPDYEHLVSCYGFDDGALDATDLTGKYNGDIKYVYNSKATINTPQYVENSNVKFKGHYSAKDYLRIRNKKNAYKGLEKIKGDNILKVLAWNIYHGGVENGVEIGRQRVVDIIKKSTADVVLMIETYGSAEYIAHSLGFHYYTLGKKDNLAIFSRFPIVEFYPSNYNGFYSLGAKIKMPNNSEVVVWDVWLKYAMPDYSLEVNRPNYKPQEMIDGDNQNAVKDINEIIQKDLDYYMLDKNTPIVLGGDFNSCSHLDWTKETAQAGLHYGMEVDFPVSKIMLANDFVDSYREVKPNPIKNIGKTWSPIFNYCDDFRIDYIYHRGQNIKVIDSRVIDHYPNHNQMFPSDHAGVLTIFEIK